MWFTNLKYTLFNPLQGISFGHKGKKKKHQIKDSGPISALGAKKTKSNSMHINSILTLTIPKEELVFIYFR